MEKLSEILFEIIEIAGEMSPYLLLGFLLAGLMHVFVPGNLYSRYLGNDGFRSVFWAALFGVPLPLCSCGVIPTAMSLRKEGASRGAAVSFLISTPQTGVDSIIATYSLMGMPFALLRPVAAFCTALFGGQMVNCFGRDDVVVAVAERGGHEGGSCCHNHGMQRPETLLGKMREALRYGFVEMMEDIGKWLVVGLVVAGLITALVPDTFFAVFRGNTLLSMLLVLAIAIPMYICATGSIPIAMALMLKGLTPGAALVMLMAGPACNVASILVINKMLGRRTLVTYLVSIILGSMAFGLGIDVLMPEGWFAPMLSGPALGHDDSMSWLSIASTLLLGVLLVNAMIQKYRHPHCHG